jgi:hypothetical protein
VEQAQKNLSFLMPLKQSLSVQLHEAKTQKKTQENRPTRENFHEKTCKEFFDMKLRQGI